MSPKEAVNFPYAWRDWWARPAQLAPPGEWSTWLVMAGRFFGKTRTGAQWIHERVKSGIARFVALVAPTAADARDVDGARAGRHPRDRPAGMEANLPAVSATIAAYHTHEADLIVAEVNNGGDLVKNTLRMIDRNVPFKPVRASRGKVTRAEPAAQIYEEGRAHHIGSFAKLEDQMAEFTIDFDRKASGYSPDRVDALVWAFTELLVEPIAGEGIYELYRQLAAKNATAKAQREQKPAPMPQPGSVEWFEMMKKRQQPQ